MTHYLTYLSKMYFYLYHLSITLRTIYSPITVSCTYLWHFLSIYTHYNFIMLFVKVLRAIPITNLSNTWNLLINHQYVNIKDCPNQKILWARPDIIDYHPTESTKVDQFESKRGQMYRLYPSSLFTQRGHKTKYPGSLRSVLL